MAEMPQATNKSWYDIFYIASFGMQGLINWHHADEVVPIEVFYLLHNGGLCFTKMNVEVRES